MNKSLITILIFVVALFYIAFFRIELISADDLPVKMAGRILIQVEDLGKAWYVSPDELVRSFLGRPDDAYSIMREQGVGITNQDLKKIPVGILGINDIDQDKDGLVDTLEKGLGTSPLKKDTDEDGFSDYEEIINSFEPVGEGVMPIDVGFAYKNRGKIFIQIQNHGEAWYVYPVDGKRYYLGQAEDAFNIMRTLGLGITNENLSKIMAVTPSFLLSEFEIKVNDGINQQRKDKNLTSLMWNEGLANIAREHSENLANENSSLTGIGASCDMPFIHHEGLNFGLTVSDRLHNRDVNYFNKAGENIALMSAATYKVIIGYGDSFGPEITDCQDKRILWDNKYKEDIKTEEDSDKIIERVNQELSKRKDEFSAGEKYEIADIEWHNIDQMAEKTIQGWVESPGHLANLLNVDYNESGIGAAYVNGYLITTQVFIKRAECGYLTGPCCVEEGYYPYCYVGMECSENICK